MPANRNLLFLFVISVLIDQSFSSLSWHLEKTDEIEIVRNNRKKENVHRGILLSYSTSAKNVICQDLFHAQLYHKENYFPREALDSSDIDATASTQHNGEEANKNDKQSEIVTEKTVDPKIDPRVTDDPENHGNPTHALVVKKLTIGDKALSDEEDIFFQCAIRDIQSRIRDEDLHLLSFAFLSSWFYISALDNERENHARLSHYMSISPEYVDFELEALEQKYVNMRETMETLETESPRYLELVKKKDDLTPLTRGQKYMLCGSILSSPIYRDFILSSRLEVSKNWIKYSKINVHYRRKDVFFSTSYLMNKKMKADCAYCRGYEHFDHYNQNEWTDLCITRSFDDKFSLYVFQADDEMGGYYMSKYFRKVPGLINAREIITRGNIVFND